MDEEKQEEDMIVREIDLYVMQYPLRPCWRPYELDERCEEVRVKPQSTEVQLDLSIDDSSNWDHAQASKFNLKKQTLSSSFMPPCASGYAVGVPTGNKWCSFGHQWNMLILLTPKGRVMLRLTQELLLNQKIQMRGNPLVHQRSRKLGFC